MKNFFEENFGEVFHILLVKDVNTGKSRGFGYITMKDCLVIEKILASKPIFINGNKIDCKIAIPKDYISEGVNDQISQKKNKSNIFFTKLTK